MTIADFNPSILFLLLWGLLSWFTKKKKKEAREVDSGAPKTVQKKEDIFARLKKLQDHLADKTDIFPLRPEEDYWEEEEESSKEEVEPEKVEEPAVQYPIPDKKEWYVPVEEKTIISVKPQNGNWLHSKMTNKNHIKKAIILNEILSEPRGLRPYGGEEKF